MGDYYNNQGGVKWCLVLVRVVSSGEILEDFRDGAHRCKLKPQQGITSHWSEWPSSKSLQIINAGENVEKRGPLYTVGGM